MSTRSKQPTGKPVGEMAIDDLKRLIAGVVQSALDPLQKSIKSLSTNVGTVQKEVAALTVRLAEKDAEIEQLHTMVLVGLDEREQYSRRNNLRIFGVKEEASEDTDQLVMDVASKVNVDISVGSIDRSHRVGKVTAGKPRPIIVKFVSYADRREVFHNKKQLKNSSITIREDLTKYRLNLLRRAVSAYSMRNVWSADGVILVKVNSSRPYRIKTESDLKKLMEKYPPPESS